jgi:uncharacterized membrane protein YccC
LILNCFDVNASSYSAVQRRCDQKSKLNQMMSRDQISIAIQNALVSLASYVVGYYVTASFHGSSSSIGALWSLISAIVVLQATTRDTWKSAVLRILGTLIGATISGLYLYFFPFNVVGMAISVGLTVLLCQMGEVPDHGRLAAITVALIMVISSSNPDLSPLVNSALRFIESVIGAGVAVLAVLLWPKAEVAT